MKNYLYILLLLVSFSIISCDVNTDEIQNNSAYINLKYSFLNLDAKNYRVTFNEQIIDLSKGLLLPLKEATGTLSVYDNATNTLEYSEPVSFNSGDISVQFIKLPGKKMEIFHPEEYNSFKLNVIYSSSANDYTITFNDNELINGVNYVRKEVGLTGLLVIHFSR